mgnify:FL=1
MNTETLQALQGSIKKWQQIVDTTTAEDRGTVDCPLCGMFWHGDCKGCPVRAATGMFYCIDSPHTEWGAHMRSAHSPGLPKHRHPGCKECLRLAEAELAFLVGLLPNEDKKQGTQP